jgi:uncharacterized membrane protein YeaQ/YmgE (transglycosylase-associated protein family)
MLNLIGWLIAGLIVGAIARLIVPGRQPMGLLMTMVLGVIGALIGGLLSWAIWGVPNEPIANYAWPGYLLSILCSVLVLWTGLAASRTPSRF